MTSRKDVRGEIREFLTTRRARIGPEQAGLPRYGGRRRVAGLRRDEVALLATMSTAAEGKTVGRLRRRKVSR